MFLDFRERELLLGELCCLWFLHDEMGLGHYRWLRSYPRGQSPASFMEQKATKDVSKSSRGHCPLCLVGSARPGCCDVMTEAAFPEKRVRQAGPPAFALRCSHLEEGRFSEVPGR